MESTTKEENAFFKLARKEQPKLLAVEESKDWKQIRPKQEYEAVNRQAWRKRKSDERDRAKEALEGQGIEKKMPRKRMKTEQEIEQLQVMERKRKLLQKIHNLIGDQNLEVFKAGFKNYKTNSKAQIDDYAKSLFRAFLGDEEPVCSLEVPNYQTRKQVLLGLEDEVFPRHSERYASLVKNHFLSCEAKPRTKKINEENGQTGVADRESQDQALCIVCYKSEELYAAKCKHVACLGCWTSWLENALECPQCRARTRKNQLVPLQ